MVVTFASVNNGSMTTGLDPAMDTRVAAWLSVRPDYGWADAPGDKPISGVASVAFGVGQHGMAWLLDLSRSAWFDGLAPTLQDLAYSGGRASGHLSDPDGTAVTDAWPNAPMASLAVSGQAAGAEHHMALQLVRSLRRRTNRQGTRMTVVATVAHGPASLAARLAAYGAFVIEGAPGVPAEHLHHFPLRAAVTPPAGRLICTDLADHLATWQPGTCSRLHLLPVAAGAAARRLQRAMQVSTIKPDNRLLNLHVLERGRPACTLTKLDLLLQSTKQFLHHHPLACVTTTEPVAGIAGWTDLLLAR